jgi:G6PDH family F420-dependent oxidoreductase
MGEQCAMTKYGYALSSEEHGPVDLVRFAAEAEKAGFDFGVISDHYHPWMDAQGQAPFIWTVLGGIAMETEKLMVGTGVTCPIIRYHPALVAQMAATAAAMMEGRFFLGIGAGEMLNEHIYGDHFPAPVERQDMLVEAIEVIRELWTGEVVNHRGEFYAVEDACLYTLPDTLPGIYMAADGKRGAGIAGEICDGLIGVAPQKELVQEFEQSGGRGKPRLGLTSVCWAKTEEEAKETAHRYWGISGLTGDAKWEIRSPDLFDGLVKGVTPEMTAQSIICGPDPKRHIEAIRKFEEAGYDHVYVHNVGPNQAEFFRLYEEQVLPELRGGGREMRKTA